MEDRPPGAGIGDAGERGERFEGFLAASQATPLPQQFFAEVLPEIEDEAELRATLYVFYAIGRRRGELRAVRASDLARERPLLRALEPWGGQAALTEALAAAVVRGTLLDCALAGGDRLYVINAEGGRRLLTRLASGALEVPGVRPEPVAPPPRRARPARVYEQEIGVLTPAVADALAEAAERYPEEWIVEALRIAARRNARSWRYAEGILRRWEAEGRDDSGPDGEGGADAITGTAAQRAAYDRVVRRSWP